MADGYRITENGVDSRIDEALNVRVTEGFTASGNGITFVGEGSLIGSPVVIYKASTSLTGSGTIQALGRLHNRGHVSVEGVSSLTATPTTILFASSSFVNVAGVWKAATIFVNRNGIWAEPVKIAYKVSGNWKRVY